MSDAALSRRFGLRPACGSLAKSMTKIRYKGYRFPPEIIQQAIWLYLRFTLSFRAVEDLLVDHGLIRNRSALGEPFQSSVTIGPFRTRDVELVHAQDCRHEPDISPRLRGRFEKG
jgi:hypothetical protein